MTSLLPPAPSNDSFERLHGQIRELLSTARARIRRAVNSTMVQTYWTIGRLIVEEEQVRISAHRGRHFRLIVDAISA